MAAARVLRSLLLATPKTSEAAGPDPIAPLARPDGGSRSAATVCSGQIVNGAGAPGSVISEPTTLPTSASIGQHVYDYFIGAYSDDADAARITARTSAEVFHETYRNLTSAQLPDSEARKAANQVAIEISKIYFESYEILRTRMTATHARDLAHTAIIAFRNTYSFIIAAGSFMPAEACNVAKRAALSVIDISKKAYCDFLGPNIDNPDSCRAALTAAAASAVVNALDSACHAIPDSHQNPRDNGRAAYANTAIKSFCYAYDTIAKAHGNPQEAFQAATATTLALREDFIEAISTGVSHQEALKVVSQKSQNRIAALLGSTHEVAAPSIAAPPVAIAAPDAALPTNGTHPAPAPSAPSQQIRENTYQAILLKLQDDPESAAIAADTAAAIFTEAYNAAINTQCDEPAANHLARRTVASFTEGFLQACTIGAHAQMAPQDAHNFCRTVAMAFRNTHSFITAIPGTSPKDACYTAISAMQTVISTVNDAYKYARAAHEDYSFAFSATIDALREAYTAAADQTQESQPNPFGDILAPYAITVIKGFATVYGAARRSQMSPRDAFSCAHDAATTAAAIFREEFREKIAAGLDTDNVFKTACYAAQEVIKGFVGSCQESPPPQNACQLPAAKVRTPPPAAEVHAEQEAGAAARPIACSEQAYKRAFAAIIAILPDDVHIAQLAGNTTADLYDEMVSSGCNDADILTLAHHTAADLIDGFSEWVRTSASARVPSQAIHALCFIAASVFRQTLQFVATVPGIDHGDIGFVAKLTSHTVANSFCDTYLARRDAQADPKKAIDTFAANAVADALVNAYQAADDPGQKPLLEGYLSGRSDYAVAVTEGFSALYRAFRDEHMSPRDAGEAARKEVVTIATSFRNDYRSEIDLGHEPQEAARNAAAACTQLVKNIVASHSSPARRGTAHRDGGRYVTPSAATPPVRADADQILALPQDALGVSAQRLAQPLAVRSIAPGPVEPSQQILVGAADTPIAAQADAKPAATVASLCTELFPIAYGAAKNSGCRHEQAITLANDTVREMISVITSIQEFCRTSGAFVDCSTNLARTIASAFNETYRFVTAAPGFAQDKAITAAKAVSQATAGLAAKVCDSLLGQEANLQDANKDAIEVANFMIGAMLDVYRAKIDSDQKPPDPGYATTRATYAVVAANSYIDTATSAVSAGANIYDACTTAHEVVTAFSSEFCVIYGQALEIGLDPQQACEATMGELRPQGNQF